MEMTFGHRAIDKIHKRRDRYEIPDWQREDVWTDSKKRLLIDSILRGWKLPKFYFLETGDGEYEVVDGQQRLLAIFEFFEDGLELTKKSADEFGGSKYSALTQTRQDAFDDFEIEFDVIHDAEEKELKEFFQRLQEGLPLTSSEKLNSIHSNLRDFARTLAKHNFFQAKVTASDKRYGHFDIVAKVAAIEVEGIDAGLRFDELKETFESQASFSPKSQIAKRLDAGFDYLDRVFPTAHRGLRHRTVVQSLATLTMRLVAAGKASGYETKLGHFFDTFLKELSRQVELGVDATDPDYLLFQRTINANLKSGARTREQILLRKLFAYDPAAVELFDAAAVATAGIQSSIKLAGDKLGELVHDINSRYSAKHGEDLFKATNKTAAALSRLGRPANTFDKYQSLIDDLYFLFWESAGVRLGGSPPDSFSDVKDLRTALRHDVDHGKTAKVRRKQKTLGQSFAKYAGAPSPFGLDPDRFPLAQLNLISAIEVDLKVLFNSLT